MQTFIDIVLSAGGSAVQVALYTLLPIMVVMMITMRFLESWGVIDKLVAWLEPVTRPFGLTGLGVLAVIQLTFVSFVAPLPTLALMEDRGASDRHLAAALAAVLAMAPANSTFPLTAMGLQAGFVLMGSCVGGLVAAASTYWLFGRRRSTAIHARTRVEQAVAHDASALKIINVSGGEAIRIVMNIIPMLLLSLVVVMGLQQMGAIAFATRMLGPVLSAVGIDTAYILPTLTKYLAGTTALVGVVADLQKHGHFDALQLNHSAGFLLHPLDLPGVAILVSAGPRVAKALAPALAGASAGIAVRAAAGLVFI